MGSRPVHDYSRISIGDVGYIRRGQFQLLFSAGSPLEGRRRGDDIPATFEQLNVGTSVFRPPRPPGCLHTSTVRRVGAGVSAGGFTAMPLDHDANFSFDLTGDHGAALVTRHQTYREDTQSESTFETYIKRHYKSWVEFGRYKGYGNNVHPVLVTGFDTTKDFSMAAYLDRGDPSEPDNITSLPMFASTPPPFLGTWRTWDPTYTTNGPQRLGLPSHQRMTDLSFSESGDTGRMTNGSNQCVFLRYYTMRWRTWMPMFPKVVRAGAGPHDLGSGDNRGDTLPSLAVEYDTTHTTSGDEDLRGWRGLTTDATGSKPNIVIQNTPQEEYDSWEAIADYVFQNSAATSVLIHHRDLAEIRAAEGVDDISSLLAMKLPRIVVEESGAGRIVCGENKLFIRLATGANISCTKHSEGKVEGREQGIQEYSIISRRRAPP